ncbi:MAG: hypothetical protein ABR573_06895 [Candidatus Dormibacteria bacterium]
MTARPALVVAAVTLLAASCSSAGGQGISDNRSAGAILAEAGDSLRQATSYRVKGMIDPGITVDLVILKNGSRGTVTTHALTFEEIALDGRLWLRGAALWKATATPRASELDGEWVRVTDPAAAYTYATHLFRLEQAIPNVVFGPRAALKRALTTFNGRRVIELSNDREIYDVLADGRPYPVRWAERDNPGPDGQPCGIILSDFNAPATLTAPESHLTLDAPASPTP